MGGIGRRATVSALALLAVLAGACGGSGRSAVSVRDVPSPAAQKRVARMVLTDGDLPGYVVESTGAERLEDQLPPPRLPHSKLAAQLIRTTWVASEHSILAAPGNVRPPIFSDANLFTRAAAVTKIWALELQRAPGVETRWLKPPPGAPVGARYAYLRKGRRALYQLGWRQGPVIGLVIVSVSPTAKLPRVARAEIGATLGRAAAAQARRITKALSFQATV